MWPSQWKPTLFAHACILKKKRNLKIICEIMHATGKYFYKDLWGHQSAKEASNQQKLYAVQLSSKETFTRASFIHPRRITDVSSMHSGCIPNLSKRMWHLIKSTLQGFALAWTQLVCVLDASCTCSRRVWTLPRSWAVLYHLTCLAMEDSKIFFLFQ